MLRIIAYLLFAFLALLAVFATAMWQLPLADHSDFDPASRADPVLVMFGDQGTGDYRQSRVAALLETFCREQGGNIAVQTLGDNFYPDGVVSVTDPLWQTHFEDMYGTPCLRGVPFNAALGNHDYGGDPAAQIAYGRTSDRWRMPDHTWAWRIESKDGVDIAIVVLDTLLPVTRQISMMEQVFAEPSEWKVVAGHHNVRTFSARYQADNRLEQELLPHLKRLGVDLYLSGHSHSLQLIARESEPVYVIAGGGGKGPREIMPGDDSLHFAATRLGFAAIDFAPHQAKVTFVTTGGEFVTNFAVDRRTFMIERQCAADGCRYHVDDKEPE